MIESHKTDSSHTGELHPGPFFCNATPLNQSRAVNASASVKAPAWLVRISVGGRLCYNTIIKSSTFSVWAYSQEGWPKENGCY